MTAPPYLGKVFTHHHHQLEQKAATCLLFSRIVNSILRVQPLLAILLLATQLTSAAEMEQTNNKATTIIVDKEKHLQSICNPETEFECQINGRCLPSEWRCDFTEQCPDGQDEWSCLPEKCNFDRDLCNWQNRFDDKLYPELEASANAKSKSEFKTGKLQTSWRRFFNHPSRATSSSSSSSSLYGRRNANNFEQNGKSSTEKNAMLRTLERLAAELPKAKATPRANFIFVPLLGTNSLEQSGEFSSPSVPGKSTEGESLRKISARSAQLRSPLISQTNSMCQLRFEYSLWSQLGFNQERSSRSRIELKLVSRDQWGEEALLWASSNFASSSPSGDDFDYDHDEGIDNLESNSEHSGKPTGHWLAEVVELGHNKAIELYFQAELFSTSPSLPSRLQPQKITTTQEAGKSSTLSNASSTTSGDPKNEAMTKTQTQSKKVEVRREGQAKGFAAISLLNFRHCGWPLGAPSSRLLTARDEEDEEFKPSKQQKQQQHLTDDYFWAEMDSLARRESVRPPSSNSTNGNRTACPKGKFLCSKLCIDSRKVCNFVDDCISSSPTMGSLGQSSEVAEDESPSGVCRLVPGMEDFEPKESMARATMPLLHTSSSSSGSIYTRLTTKSQAKTTRITTTSGFWSLAGNWPADKIKLQRSDVDINKADKDSNQADSIHLPSKDHTPNRKGLGGGHYLVLLIPPREQVPLLVPRETSSSQKESARQISNQARALWIHLESRWLKKKKTKTKEQRQGISADNDQDYNDNDCRVKFFYNLVSRNSRRPPHLAAKSGLPFNLYLMIEHVVMPSNTSTVSPKLDSLVYLRRFSNEKVEDRKEVEEEDDDEDEEEEEEEEVEEVGEIRQRIIEWPGVDFWRESNHLLLDLKDDDIFYIRITLMIVFDNDDDVDDDGSEKSAKSIASFSFDDLSTHLGCSYSEELDEKFQRDADQRFELPNWTAPKIADIIRAARGPAGIIENYQRHHRNKKEGLNLDSDDNPKPMTHTLRRKSLYKHLQLKIEPHRLILYVLAVLISMFGLIFMIVFIVVPHVERAVISFHDQLLLSLNDNMDDTPRNSLATISRDNPLTMMHRPNSSTSGSSSSSSSLLSGEACELTENGASDWDHLATSGGRWRYLSSSALGTRSGAAAITASTGYDTNNNNNNNNNGYDESYLTNDSAINIMDSDSSSSQRLSSVGDSFVILQENIRNGSGETTTNSNNISDDCDCDRDLDDDDENNKPICDRNETDSE